MSFGSSAGLTLSAASLVAAAITLSSVSDAAAGKVGPSSNTIGFSQPLSDQLATQILERFPRGGASQDKDKSAGSKDNSSKKKSNNKNRRSQEEGKHNNSNKNANAHGPADTSETPTPKPRKPDVKQSKHVHSDSNESNTRQPHDHTSAANRRKQPSGNAPPPIVDEILREEDYYKVLGLTKQEVANDPKNSIKKAYRRRALLTHPDKTDGDRRAFDKVAEAYEILSDETKRKMYDRFGKKAVPTMGAGGGGFPTAEELFRSFFGQAGMSSSRGFMPPRRNRTSRYQLEVSLEDLYKGATRTVLVSPSGAGLRGEGSSTKRVQVHIPRGARNGETVRLSGEMDFDPDDVPGDLIFELVQRKHSIFTRKGYDLAVSLDIRFREAITGVRRKLTHLDGREIVVESPQRQAKTSDPNSMAIPIHDGDVHVLKGYGMPKDSVGHEFGDLYVQYNVATPKVKNSDVSPLTLEETQQLGELLDKVEGVHTKVTEDSSKQDVLHLAKASASDFGRASGQPPLPQNHPDDPFVGEDEEEHPFHFPFGTRGSQFFFHSSSTHSNPFFGMRQPGAFHEEDVDESTQCQQM